MADVKVILRCCLLSILLTLSQSSVPCVCNYGTSSVQFFSSRYPNASAVANFPGINRYGNAYCFQVVGHHLKHGSVKAQIDAHKVGFVYITDKVIKTTCQTADDKTTTTLQPSTSTSTTKWITVSKFTAASTVGNPQPSTTPVPTHNCLCNVHHVELFIMECSNFTTKVIGILHQTDNRNDTSPDHCIAIATGLKDPKHWKAVVVGSKVGYVQIDQGIEIRKCPGSTVLANSGMISNRCSSPSQTRPSTVHPASTTHPCVCNTNHQQVYVRQCPGDKTGVIGILYEANIMPDYSSAHCAPIASRVHTARGWDSVMIGNQVGFVQLDQGVTRHQCPGPAPSFSSGMISKKCNPYLPTRLVTTTLTTTQPTAFKSTTQPTAFKSTTQPHPPSPSSKLPDRSNSVVSLHSRTTSRPPTSSQTQPSGVFCVCVQMYNNTPIMECPDFRSRLLGMLHKTPRTPDQKQCAPLAFNIPPIVGWTAVVINDKVGFIMQNDKDKLTNCKGMSRNGNEQASSSCNIHTTKPPSTTVNITPSTTVNVTPSATVNVTRTITKGQSTPLVINTLWTLLTPPPLPPATSIAKPSAKSTTKLIRTPPPLPPATSDVKPSAQSTTKLIRTPPPLPTTTLDVKTSAQPTTKLIRTPTPLPTATSDVKPSPQLTTKVSKLASSTQTTTQATQSVTTGTQNTPTQNQKTTAQTTTSQTTTTAKPAITKTTPLPLIAVQNLTTKVQRTTPSVSTTTMAKSTTTTAGFSSTSAQHSTGKPFHQKTCDRVGLLHSYIKREKIQHQKAGRCDDTLRHDSEAAVIKHCGAPMTTSWTPSDRVMDHCDKSRLYHPVGAFASNMYFFNAGVLLGCFDGGQTIEVFMQDCSSGLHIQNITMADGADLLHFVDW